MTETQNEYREESGAGNHYRTAYHQGLEALLARLQKQSDGLRKQLHKMLLERPEAFRRQIRQSLGWPLTEKREDVLCLFRLPDVLGTRFTPAIY